MKVEYFQMLCSCTLRQQMWAKVPETLNVPRKLKFSITLDASVCHLMPEPSWMTGCEMPIKGTMTNPDIKKKKKAPLS